MSPIKNIDDVRLAMHDTIRELTCRCIVERFSAMSASLQGDRAVPQRQWLTPLGEVTEIRQTKPIGIGVRPLEVLRLTNAIHLGMRQRLKDGEEETAVISQAWPPLPTLCASVAKWVIDDHFVLADERCEDDVKVGLITWYATQAKCPLVWKEKFRTVLRRSLQSRALRIV